jgi:hypothetical protein
MTISQVCKIWGRAGGGSSSRCQVNCQQSTPGLCTYIGLTSVQILTPYNYKVNLYGINEIMMSMDK